ncbi:MAG: hypothetical protein ACXACP_04050 [Candidatus Hodarchaeales archaeon]
MNKMNLDTADPQFKTSRNNSKDEDIEMLSRLGWKWAVLASTAGRIYQNGNSAPAELLQKIRISRSKIESGCYSICETTCDLRDIEVELFPEIIKQGPYESDRFLELSSKALNGTITEKDIDLVGTSPILSDCIGLPCVCRE